MDGILLLFLTQVRGKREQPGSKSIRSGDAYSDCADGRERQEVQWFDHGKPNRAVNPMSDLKPEAGLAAREVLRRY